MAIYREIAAFGGNKGAVYLGSESFSNLALTTLRNALSVSVGQVIRLVSPYAVRFELAHTSAPNERTLEAKFQRRGKDIFLVATQPMTLDFSLGVFSNDSFASTITDLMLVVNDLEFQVDIGEEKLVCSAGDAHLAPSFKRVEDFDKVLTDYGLDRDTTTRVEGMLLYSGLAAAVTQTVLSPHTVDLKRLFPGVLFQGRLEFDVSRDGDFLFMRGAEGIACRPGSVCDCADIGNGIGQVQPGRMTPRPSVDPIQDRTIGAITIGGPLKVDPFSDPAILGAQRRGQGDIGLYMPNEMASDLVAGPYPGVRFDLRDHGFIGWKAAAFVDFSGISLKFEPDFGRFYVTLTFRVELYGSVHVDLGKFGKIRVTDFSAEQAGSGVNSVKIGFYIVIGTKGLFLKPVLENVSFGTFDVNLTLGTLVGTPFGTWGAVSGFIFDKILGLITASKIPIHLDLELRKFMAKAMIPILDARYAAELAGIDADQLNHLTAFYDGKSSEGFLFSTGKE